jgi:hypothetical protein
VDPHPQDADRPQVGEDLVDQAMMNVHAAGLGAKEITDEFLEQRRRSERVGRNQDKKDLRSLLQAALSELLRVTNRLPGEATSQGTEEAFPGAHRMVS